LGAASIIRRPKPDSKSRAMPSPVKTPPNADDAYAARVRVSTGGAADGPPGREFEFGSARLASPANPRVRDNVIAGIGDLSGFVVDL
jgi:hypothetical protein